MRSSPGLRHPALSPSTPQVLIIPEILEVIFSFLSPQKCRVVASLVCKQWRDVIQRMILSTSSIWAVSATTEKRLEVLQHAVTSAKILSLQREDTRLGQPGDRNERANISWDLALKGLIKFLEQHKMERCQNIGNTMTGSWPPKLHELVLEHLFSRDNRLFALLDLVGSSLCILRLERLKSMLPQLLSKVMLTCPNLEQLYIVVPRAHAKYPQPVLPTETILLSTEVVEAAVAAALPLQKLVIQYLVVTNATLKLLRSLAHLTELRVMDSLLGVGTTVQGNGLVQDSVEVIMTEFIVRLSESCPRLGRFQFSFLGPVRFYYAPHPQSKALSIPGIKLAHRK